MRFKWAWGAPAGLANREWRARLWGPLWPFKGLYRERFDPIPPETPKAMTQEEALAILLSPLPSFEDAITMPGTQWAERVRLEKEAMRVLLASEPRSA